MRRLFHVATLQDGFCVPVAGRSAGPVTVVMSHGTEFPDTANAQQGHVSFEVITQ